MKPIIFPGLGLEFDISRIAFRVMEIDIYWYGIIIASTIILSLILIYKDKNREIKWDDITSFLLWAIPVGFIFARLYYVIFEFDYYISNPLDIFKIWNGGIAIYGGIIGASLTAIIFCRIKNISIVKFLDYLVPYLALSQSIGRLGNFINREAYGTITNLPWKMGIFKEEIGDYIFVHPTFIYEALITLFIFVLLKFIVKKKRFSGQNVCLYMVIYGIGRALVEGLRTDSLMVGSVRVSALLGLVLAIIFFIIYIVNYNIKEIAKSVERK